MKVEIVLKSGYSSGVFAVDDGKRAALETGMDRRGEWLRRVDGNGNERFFKNTELAAVRIVPESD